MPSCTLRRSKWTNMSSRTIVRVNFARNDFAILMRQHWPHANHNLTMNYFAWIYIFLFVFVLIVCGDLFRRNHTISDLSGGNFEYVSTKSTRDNSALVYTGAKMHQIRRDGPMSDLFIFVCCKRDNFRETSFVVEQRKQAQTVKLWPNGDI